MSKKHFTYNVACSFNVQFTFPESDVEQSDEGGEGDMSPTDSALEALGKEIEECLCERFGGVANVEVCADFDDLMGVDEDEVSGESLSLEGQERSKTNAIQLPGKTAKGGPHGR